MRAAVLELFQRVVLASPVDTGRFRGNWQITSDSPASGTLDQLDPSGSNSLQRIATHMNNVSKPLEMEVWLVNNLPYAEPLENGYSAQAPSGMVRLNVAEFPQIFAKRVRNTK